MPAQRTIHGGAHSEHYVTLFDDLETRAAAVARFVVEARARQEPVVLVATARNWEAIGGDLRRRGVDAGVDIATGRLVLRDAQELLRIVCRGRMPVAEAFERHVGSLVHGLAERFRCHVSVYGEMVDVLAANRDIDAALALEALWNEVAEREPLRLMCGYASAHFVTGAAAACLGDVCRAHDFAHVHRENALGAWVLRTAQLPYRSVPSIF